MLGQVLGHYKILEKIGEGGMGVVFRAHDESLDRDVAIKVLPSGLLADEPARKRFRNEALALAKLNHPNVEAVYEFNTEEGNDFLVMEYVPGVTLSDQLAAGPLPEKEVLRLGTQLTEGLAAAHAENIIHRDLKPGNLRLTPDGRLKILDFGLAKLVRPPSDAAVTGGMTNTHAVSGTLPYMAPEQLQGNMADARSDIYAAGVVLYEMATGKRPFDAKLPTPLADEILHRTAPSPRATNAQVSAELERSILKCLDKNPVRRYQSARELHANLVHLRDTASGRRRAVSSPSRRASARQVKSLAVLPLANLSRDPEQEYFADGMTEELITNLAKIGALKVISRTTMMRYKGSEKSVPEIASELNVDAVVEGSVLRVGERVRITAQLIHAATDTHLWAESYDRDVRDVLALQSEAARAIAAEIQIKLKPQERVRLERTRRVDPEAHEALLKGRYHWNKWSPEGLQKGVEYFQQAIEKDPTYAAAYAGLAESYVFLGYWGYLPAMEAYPRAKAAVLKALELDDTLAETHRSLFAVRWFYDWDLPACQKEIAIALELNPNDPYSTLWQATFLAVIQADFAKAIAQGKRAQELDPLSPFIGAVLGWIFFWASQFSQAIEQAQKMIDMHPNLPQPYYVLGCAHVKTGRFAEAVVAFEKAADVAPDTISLSFLGLAYGMSGQTDKARAILSELQERSRREFVPSARFAYLYFSLGEADKALECLEKAYEEHDSHLFWLRNVPFYDAVSSDPRFQDLLRRMNFPP
jgi:serine/threonine protein kinase